jgi:outer membrane protein, heavy metal efflux system
MKKSIFIGKLIVCLLMLTKAYSQDTLKLSLSQAQRLFTERNLLLLAQKYNIEANKAFKLQASLWNNPTVSLEQMLYNSKTQKFLPIAGIADDPSAPTTQQAIQIQQLFLLAGKRNKQIKIADITTEISEYAFYDLIRTLSFELNTRFYSLYFAQQNVAMYESGINRLKGLVDAYKEQYQKNNIPLKEVIRLQSFMVEMEQELSLLRREIYEHQGALKSIIGDNSISYVVSVANQANFEKVSSLPLSLATLFETAEVNRYDLKATEAQTRLAAANLALQKALRTPDLTVGYLFDRAGSSVPRYNAVTFQFSLPTWNKNQGNIKAAESQIEASKKYYDQTKLSLQNDILSSLRKAQEADKTLQNFDKTFVPNFTTLIEGVVANYLKRNISLLEFVDFVESYKNSLLLVNQLQHSRLQSFEELNFTIGKQVLNVE